MRKTYTLIAFFGLLLPLTLISCNATRAKVKALRPEVESYHRDLIFERYDVAAKRLAPGSRFQWLSALQSQGIRFSEIQIQATEECAERDGALPQNGDEGKDSGETRAKSAAEPALCVDILSLVQWYSANSPTVQTSRIATKWVYDEEEKTWRIAEQSEM